jgi:anthranilate phosphoribosyltransferase
MIVQAIAKLAEGESLSLEEAAATMEDVMEERATPAQFGAFVTALRLKGETAEEIAGMAQVMRRKAVRVVSDVPVVDTCGTGGDGSGTFNVSTAAALVVAAAEQAVAKHGNRGMSSRCGSADVLEALGVNILLGPEAVARCIDEVRIGFMFAPSYHPAMKFAAPLRREIGIRNVFNILGPLTNPAGASRQVLGAPSVTAQEQLAGALQRLGAERALVVHGLDGLDELSICGPSRVLDLRVGQITSYVVHPEEVGLRVGRAEDIRGGDAETNAAMLRDILGGTQEATLGVKRDMVALNAGAALLASGAVADLPAGVRLASDVLRSGAALATLEAWARTSQALGRA